MRGGDTSKPVRDSCYSHSISYYISMKGISPDEVNRTMIRIQEDIIEYMNSSYFMDQRRHSRVILKLCTLIEKEMRFLEKMGKAYRGDVLEYPPHPNDIYTDED